VFWVALQENIDARQIVSRELVPESHVIVKTDERQTNSFRFRIGATQYFNVRVEAVQAELALSLIGPDRQINRVIGCSWGGSRFSEIAKAGGEYRLDVSVCDGELAGEYQVILSSVRSPTQTDQIRVVAERAAVDALRLTQATPSHPAAALRKYEEALRLWNSIGDRVEQSRTLEREAELYRDSGDSKRALEWFTRALELSRTEGLDPSRVAALRGLATVYLRNGDTVRALNYASEAIELSRATSDQPAVAEALLVAGDVYYFAGDFDKAAGAYEQAYAIWEGLHYRRGQAQSLLYLGFIDIDRNEFTQAFGRGQRARSLFEEIGDELGRARSFALLGHVLSGRGHKQEALDLFEESRSVLNRSTDTAGQANLLNGIARIYADLGDYNSAIPTSKSALEKYIASGDAVAEAITLEAIGLYYFAAGDLTNARVSTERALKEFQGLGNKRAEADSWLRLAVISEALGEKRIALDDLNRSLEMSRASGNRRLEASALLALGRIRDTAGDLAAALQLYRESLGLHKATENHFGEITALYHIANCLRRMGDLRQSLDSSEAAIDIIEKLRTSLASSGLRTYYFASARQQYDLYIDSLMRRGTEPDISSAFEVSEKARARSLLDSITETRVSVAEAVDPVLAERETFLRASIDRKSEQYTQLSSISSASKELSALNDELHRLNAEYEEVHGQLRTRSPRYSTLVQPQPLGLREIRQQVLDKDSLLLEYALGEEKSYLWALTRDDFGSYVLPSRSEIEKKVRRLRELMTARAALQGEKPADFQARLKVAEAQYPEAAAELSRMLLGPVGDRLATRRLVIVAEGVLQYLPFGALPTPQSLESPSFTPLIIEHEIVNLPSASTLAVIRREVPLRGTPDRTIAVFADPVFQAKDSRVRRLSYTQSAPARVAARTAPAASVAQVLRGSDAVGIKIDLPRLPSTRQEAEAILAMVPEDRRMAALGFGATRAAAMNPELKRYRIVHFATHTILNDDHPDLSSLVLSLVDEKGNPQSGFLRLRDMYNLQLAAELVVLSACDTALGKEVKGEGLMSMVRGFMYSGTPRVLASLWKVDDEATAELMKEFYKHLLQEGMTPAAALRQAQITQMQKKSRQWPYYWAGFQLQGEWN
jgi:CHAT domain-containing protein/tetratricopeptide (TPR) repeat protein